MPLFYNILWNLKCNIIIFFRYLLNKMFHISTIYSLVYYFLQFVSQSTNILFYSFIHITYCTSSTYLHLKAIFTSHYAKCSQSIYTIVCDINLDSFELPDVDFVSVVQYNDMQREIINSFHF